MELCILFWTISRTHSFLIYFRTWGNFQRFLTETSFEPKLFLTYSLFHNAEEVLVKSWKPIIHLLMMQVSVWLFSFCNAANFYNKQPLSRKSFLGPCFLSFNSSASNNKQRILTLYHKHLYLWTSQSNYSVHLDEALVKRFRKIQPLFLVSTNT